MLCPLCVRAFERQMLGWDGGLLEGSGVGPGLECLHGHRATGDGADSSWSVLPAPLCPGDAVRVCLAAGKLECLAPEG